MHPSVDPSEGYDAPRMVSLDAAAARIWARYAEVMGREGVDADALQVRARCGSICIVSAILGSESAERDD